MADWKNVHLAEQDAEIAALRAQVDELENQNSSLRSRVSTAENRATRAEAERDELRSRLSGDVPIGVYAALAGIRSALGVHERPMLDELEGIVRSVVTERDEARGRVEKIEWLVECGQAFWLWNGNPDAESELWESYRAALAECGEVK